MKKFINGVHVDMTTDEQAKYDARQTDWDSKSGERKLAKIKEIRLQKLIETDYLALSDVVLSDAWKAKRQSWRDIPQNNSTDAEYEALLKTDANGNLTNAIWSDA